MLKVTLLVRRYTMGDTAVDVYGFSLLILSVLAFLIRFRTTAKSAYHKKCALCVEPRSICTAMTVEIRKSKYLTKSRSVTLSEANILLKFDEWVSRRVLDFSDPSLFHKRRWLMNISAVR